MSSIIAWHGAQRTAISGRSVDCGYKPSMNISAIGPVGGGGSVYALSPFLNGVRRKPDAASAAAALQAVATATTTPVAPFANPAIAQIAQQAAITVENTLAQSYVAAALLAPAASLPFAPTYVQPVTSAIPPIVTVTRTAKGA